MRQQEQYNSRAREGNKTATIVPCVLARSVLSCVGCVRSDLSLCVLVLYRCRGVQERLICYFTSQTIDLESCWVAFFLRCRDAVVIPCVDKVKQHVSTWFFSLTCFFDEI